MALLGNHSRLNFGAFRSWGISPSLSGGNRHQGGEWFNWIRQHYATNVLSLAAKPTGYYPEATYRMALIAGELSSAKALDASGDVSNANLAGGLNGIVALVGSGDITNATGSLILILVAALVGSGTITNANAAAVLSAIAALVGSGDISNANASAAAALVAALVGSGTITNANAAAVLSAVAALTGSGDITNATGALILVLVAALLGSGDITNADGIAVLNGIAALVGSGDISNANINALGILQSVLSGSSSVSLTIAAIGELISSITVTGSTLTTANVADAVWNALAAQYNGPGTLGQLLNDSGSSGNPWDTLIDAGFSAQQILRIIAAAVAGKSSGGPATPVFRNVADTKDQISGTADTSGNRINITYGS